MRCTAETCEQAEVCMIWRTHSPSHCPERCTCEDCDGSGYTVQGWTNKNGYSEDQYGPCHTCNVADVGHLHQQTAPAHTAPQTTP